MSDRYANFVKTPIGKAVAPKLGLPQPPTLERHAPGKPVVDGAVLLGAAPGGRLAEPVAKVLKAIGADAWTSDHAELRDAAAKADLDARIFNADGAGDTRFKALVLDATGIESVDGLKTLYEFFHPLARRLAGNGRIVVLGTPPEDTEGRSVHIAQRALEGFTRSAAKELKGKGGGATTQLVYVAPGAEDRVESTLRFLLSPRSAYVDGQVVRIGTAVKDAGTVEDWNRPLAGRTVLVTGASRGIGLAIAETLSRDGAHVVGLDIPPAADELRAAMEKLGGSSLALDVTADDAPAQIGKHLKDAHGTIDGVVHNAGITRDKTLARMDEAKWDQVLGVNLHAVERITDHLVDTKVVKDGGRIVGVASIAGIAGNFGQTNYGTSKAGVIGFVEAFAPDLAGKGITVNAVAPGFIETAMTAAMPLGPREVGRRASSLGQGGLPVDVAETIGWYLSPASGGVTGNVVRVCGQSHLGA